MFKQTKIIAHRLLIVVALQMFPLMSVFAQQGRDSLVVVVDTVEVEDNPYARRKDDSYVPGDSAKAKGQEDPIRYRMDTRYLAQGDSLGKRHWYDNMFLELGLGLEQLIAPSDAYAFKPFTTVHGGLGIQLGKYHSLRGIAEATVGYQKNKDILFLRGEAKMDHLFDLSSYFDGYDPTRLLAVSTILGGGLQYSMLRSSGSNMSRNKKGLGAEIHAGLQLRFNTGPRGSFNVEPYIGIGPDRMDLSGNNWRKTDIFYGVNVNYIYYFNNHLTRAARMRLISERDSANYLTKDSLLQSWAHPWFFEVAAGPVWLDGSQVSLSESMGHNISLSVGKWFSPVIGVRATGSERMTTWASYSEVVNNVEHVKTYGNHYLSFRVDALFNPFGFTRNYNWNAPAGAYLLGGYELGWFSKSQPGTPLRCFSESYSGGVHLWMRLSEGVQFFVEPRFMHNTYKIPYKNVPWNHQYSDNSYMVNLGVTATGLSKKYRAQLSDDTERSMRPARWSFGVGGGTNLIQTFVRYDEKESFPFNVNGFAQYHFDAVSAVRLGLEYFVHSATDYTQYNDYNVLMHQKYNMGPVTRKGLWDHTYYLGMATLNYSINLTNLIGGYRPGRLFEVEAFGGPGLAFFFGQTGHLNEKELLYEGHEAQSKIGIKQGAYGAVNGGVKLSANLTPKIGLYVSPQLFYIHNIDLQAIQITRTGILETLDLGVQYRF